jgi:hypothetical protein
MCHDLQLERCCARAVLLAPSDQRHNALIAVDERYQRGLLTEQLGAVG